LRQPNASWQAINQKSTQLAFQQVDASADRWLGEMQEPSRSGEPTGTPAGDKGFHLAQVHSHQSS